MNEKTKSAWKTWAKEIAVVLVIVLAVRAYQSRNARSGLAPVMQLQQIDGRMAAIGGQHDGPLMVHFWATWCGVCKAEEGNVSKLVEGGHVVTIASNSGSNQALEKALEARGLTWPVVNDADGELARQWGVGAYPTTFYLSPSGEIQSVEVGYTTTLGMKARLWWAGK